MPDRVTPHFQTGWRLFKSQASVFLVAFLLNIAGPALLGLGLILSFPASLLAIIGFYRSIQPATT